MGEKGVCGFCNGKKIMRKSPEIGEPLIEYYCPECSTPDETKYPKVTCPACNGIGNLQKLTASYEQASIIYRNNRLTRICYMCNGRGEITIISEKDKDLSNSRDIRLILKKKTVSHSNYNDSVTKKSSGKRGVEKYNFGKVKNMIKKIFLALILLGIFLLFIQSSFIIHSNQTNDAMNSIHNIDNKIGMFINSIISNFDAHTNPTINPATLEINAGIRVLNYTLRGHNGHIQFIVYGGLNNWLTRQPRAIIYDSYSSPPTDKDFVMKVFGDKYQDKSLNKLVYKIQNIAPDRNNQARIAISLVQHIPYDYTALRLSNFTERYPYQVIYDNAGVCEGKSELLAYLLNKLGFGVVLFDFKKENHMAVGIKCAPEYAYRDTDYCFVESTEPTIVTDSWGTYAGGIKLYSMPEVIEISNGYTFNASMEYHDALLFKQLNERDRKLNLNEYFEWENLVKKYGIEVNENKFITNNIQKGYNKIYNNIVKLEDHQFTYIPVAIRIGTIHLSINASKPVSMYVLNGSQNKILNGFEYSVIPSDSMIQGCMSNNFKKQVNLTCKLGDEYTSLGVLLYNEGIGNNTIKVNIIGKKVR